MRHILFSREFWLGAVLALLAGCSATTAAVPRPSSKTAYNLPPISGTTATPHPKAGSLVDIVRDPSDLPPSVGTRPARRVEVNLYTEEVTGRLADGTTYDYWTFNGKVPGPFVRVRVGDEVTVHLTNDPASSMMHSVDMHAVLGPGGGASATQTNPGASTGFTFRATTPGLFVYHCATPMIAAHIANGMYGMILVEPAGGLSKVSREYYVMQGEIYTSKPYGSSGHQDLSYAHLMAETPDYFVFNGAVGALTHKYPLTGKVGERIRIFFGNAGPNKPSSLHAVGLIFDKVYVDGSLESPPLRGVQTVLIPPGGAAMVEFTPRVPGKYMLVDHAIVRVERGLRAAINISGPKQPELFAPWTK